MNEPLHPMTPEEIVASFDKEDLQYIDERTRDHIRTSLRALLLHVGESLPDGYGKETDYDEGRSDALDDCKRVIEKMMS